MASTVQDWRAEGELGETDERREMPRGETGGFERIGYWMVSTKHQAHCGCAMLNLQLSVCSLQSVDFVP
jgi:hypothetical protein